MKSNTINSDLPKIEKILENTFGSKHYTKINRLGGLTNHTYYVGLDNGEEYAVRIPGDGTEKMIIRMNEKKSTQLACKLNIDAPLVYFGDDGSKISKYLTNAETMSKKDMQMPINIIHAARIFNKLHHCEEKTDIPFEVFEMAANYEDIIIFHGVDMFLDYSEIKKRVMKIKQEIDSQFFIEKVPCHNDPLCENWIRSDGAMYLIDWEYAGMNDGIWDLADLSIEAEYTHEQDTLLLTTYYNDTPTIKIWRHFYANKIYVDYLWTLWAKARVPFDGAPMENWALERYTRLKGNLNLYSMLHD